MSDVMFYGILRLPFDLAMGDEMARRQFYSAVQDAANRVERAEAEIERLRARSERAEADLEIERHRFDEWLKRASECESEVEQLKARAEQAEAEKQALQELLTEWKKSAKDSLAEVERLRADADGIHSCGPECKRPGCVAARERSLALVPDWEPELEHSASAVAQLVYHYDDADPGRSAEFMQRLRAAAEELVSAERERCAKVCEALERKSGNAPHTHGGFTCADAIRRA